MIEEYQVADLKKEAKEGIVEAQMGLGALYYSDGNYEEAMKWYEMASKQGNIDGKMALASLCFIDPPKEVKSNSFKGILLLEECCRYGNKIAEELMKHPKTVFTIGLHFGNKEAFEHAVSEALDSDEPEETLKKISREIKMKKQEENEKNKKIDSVTPQPDESCQKERKDYIIERDLDIQNASFNYKTKLQMQQEEIMKDMEQYSHKSTLKTMILCMFLMHRLANGKILTGLLQIATIGGLFVWQIYDLMLIGSGRFKDKNGKYINSAKVLEIQREAESLEENYKSGEKQYYTRKKSLDELKRLEYIQCCEELGYMKEGD